MKEVEYYPSFRTLASDGSMVVADGGGGIGIWKRGEIKPVPLPAGAAFGRVALSDDGGTLIIAASARIAAIDLVSGKETLVAERRDSNERLIFMAASNDVRFVLYRVVKASYNGLAYLADRATGQSAAIPLPEDELVMGGTLSGLGEHAFLATTAGRVVKYAFASGKLETVIPATQYCMSIGPMARGSLEHLSCDFVRAGDDVRGRILLDGVAVPVLYTKNGEVAIQVPWERKRKSIEMSLLTLDMPSQSPFQVGLPVSVLDRAAHFETADRSDGSLRGIRIMKENFSGYVTSPPKPGEIVHIYMTGLGPVTPPVETAVPASSEVLSRLNEKLTCRFLPQTENAETLFAGLAPGMIGVYQGTFRIPNAPGEAGAAGIRCEVSNGGVFMVSPINQQPTAARIKRQL